MADNTDLISDLQRNAAMAREFVRQLDAPTLHHRLNAMATLCDRAAAEIVRLEGANYAMKKSQTKGE